MKTKITKITKTNAGVKIFTPAPTEVAIKLSDRLCMNESRFDTIDIQADGVVLTNWEV